MAISYLSKPSQIEVTPYQEPIEFIMQAANIKQNRYDKILDVTFQKENSLLALDTQYASQEVTDKKTAMLAKMEEDLNANIGKDLLNPANIDKIESIFKPISLDKDIIQGVNATANIKAEGANFDLMRKKGNGSYDAKNEDYFWRKAKENVGMTLEQVKKRGGYNSPVATEYTDIDKLYRESVKDLHPEVKQVMTGDGRYIYTKKGSVISQQEILALLPTNAKVMAQAEINAFYDYQGVGKDQLLSAQRNSILDAQKDNVSTLGEIDKQTGYIRDNIKKIESGTKEGVAYVEQNGGDKKQALDKLKSDLEAMESQKTAYAEAGKSYAQQLQDFDSADKGYAYDPNTKTFKKELDDDSISSLKTNMWLNNKKQSFSKAWAYSDETWEAKPDEYNMKYVEHNYKVDEANLTAQNNLAHDVYMENLEAQNGKYRKKTGGSSGDGVDTDGDGISDVDGSPLGAIAGEAPIGTDMPKDFQGLQAQLGSVTEAKNKTLEAAVSDINASGSGTPLDSKTLLKQAEAYRVTAKEFKDKQLSLDATMPNSNQTYRQYFNSERVQDIKSFVEKYDLLVALETNNSIILTQVEQKAKNVAKSLLPGGKFSSQDIVSWYTKFEGFDHATNPYKNVRGITDINGILQGTSNALVTGLNALNRVEYKVVVPAALSEKYTSGNLSRQDYIQIMKNSNLSSDKDSYELSKKIIDKSTPQDKNISAYRSAYITAKNKFSEQYGKGYIASDYQILNNVDKGAGKDMDLDAKKYIQNATVNDVKLKGKQIEVLKFMRDPKSTSGWKVKFNAYPTSIDENGKELKGTPVTSETPLDAQFVARNGLNQKAGVTFIQESLEQQYNGNLDSGGMYDGKLPQFIYNYGGNVYKFLRLKDGTVRLQEKVGNEFVSVRGNQGEDVSSIELGLALIEKKNSIDAR